jgi:hypothetical protein
MDIGKAIKSLPHELRGEALSRKGTFETMMNPIWMSIHISTRTLIKSLFKYFCISTEGR